MNGYYTVECTNILPKAVANEHNTRGHSLKLLKRRCATKQRKYYFLFRVVNLWNSLPEHVISAPSIDTFKGRLDKHWFNLRYSMHTDILPIDLMDMPSFDMAWSSLKALA